MTDITPAVRADLAPTGKLHAGVNYGNLILATKDRATGGSRGVAVLSNEAQPTGREERMSRRVAAGKVFASRNG